jgi:glyoxylase-like metal-dependent hydrolase (beta-lactamase superfamily II)
VTYTGKVHPGGPAGVHELTPLLISKLSVGPMDNNAYLLRCRTTGEQVLIDAAEEPDRLLDLVGDSGQVAVVEEDLGLDRDLGCVELGVVHLVGHTPGSIALVFDDPTGDTHVFTGDCLFPGGVGRTTTPEDFASLYGGVVDKLFGRLPDETWVYPGHGDDTTLGAERPHLAEWLARGW